MVSVRLSAPDLALGRVDPLERNHLGEPVLARLEQLSRGYRAGKVVDHGGVLIDRLELHDLCFLRAAVGIFSAVDLT